MASATTTSFTLPDNLDEFTGDELAELRSDIVAEFDEVKSDENISPKDKVARLTELRDANATIKDAEASLAEAESLIGEMEAEIAPDDEDDGADSANSDEDPANSDDDADELVHGEDAEAPETTGDTDIEDDDDDEEEEMAAGSDDAGADGSDSADSTSTDSTSTGADAEVIDLPVDESDESDEDDDLTNSATNSDANNSTDTNQEATAVAASSSPQSTDAPDNSSAPPRPSTTAINANRGGDSSSSAPDKTSKDLRPYGGRSTIVAAANLDGFDTGQELDSVDQIAEAWADRTRGFPRRGSGNERIKAGVAKITKSFPDELKVPKGHDIEPYASVAADETNLPGGSLTAAGGWCAPSEVWYDLPDCGEASMDGLLSLPSVQVSRGGVKHTLGPDFRTVIQAQGFFHFTEADAIAGNYDNGEAGDKPCMVVPCPDFVEDRLDVDGLCITSDILQDTGYPELLPKFIQYSLAWHAHKMNALRIKHLVDNSTDVPLGTISGPTVTLLSALELQATDIRYANLMDRNTTMEVVLPLWATGPLRVDLANRLGVENFMDVSDSTLVSYMRERKVNPQFVYDWQSHLSAVAVTGAGEVALTEDATFGADTPPTEWPTDLDVLMYPAGTWVQGEDDVISIEAIYDSNNLPQNNFTALFTEEAWMVMQRCRDSRKLDITLGADYGDTNSGQEDPAA